MKTTVPKIIHQVWLGDTPAPVKIMRSWSVINPMYKYMLWTDARVKNFPLQNRDLYDWLKSPIMRCDLLRYELLYAYGGVYIDADFLCLKPIDHLLINDFFAAQDNFWWKRHGDVASGFLGCYPKHPLAKLLVGEFGKIQFKKRTGHGGFTTGPRWLTDVWRKSDYNITVLPRELYTEEPYKCPAEAITCHVNASHKENLIFYDKL